jgi:hypothetical protein
VDKLTGVTKELSLGPGQAVLEQLVDLEKLMMQDETHDDDVKKAMAALNNCFPIIKETAGETMDEDVL